MFPKSHIILGLIFSGLLYAFFPITLLQAAIIFLASILIDIDHYTIYVCKKRDLSFKRAYKWNVDLGKIREERAKKNPKIKFPIYVLHTIEFLIVLILISVYFNYYFILIGFLFHHIVDALDIILKKFINEKEFLLIRYLFSDKSNYI